MANSLVASWGIQPLIRPDLNVARYIMHPPEPGTTIIWGKAGDDAYQSRFTFNKNDDKPDQEEVKRKYDVVRVKDPDNEDNHIDVEVLTELSMRNKIDDARTKIDDSRTKLRFAKTKPSKDVEILERDKTR